MIPVQFQPANHRDGALVLFAIEGGAILAGNAGLDHANIGQLKQILTQQEFTGKKGEVAALPAPAMIDVPYLFVAGLGKAESITHLSLQETGGAVYARLAATPVTTATLSVAAAPALAVAEEELAAHVLYGLTLRSYRFDKYITREKEGSKKPKLARVIISSAAYKAAEKLFDSKKRIAEAVALARTLQNEPANVIYPESLADAAVEAVRQYDVKAKILTPKEMKKMGMNALLGVAQGSVNEARIVVMEYYGADDKKAPPIAFVGKGVTFDTGGISIKPSAGMEDMKWDMGGSAVVIGTMQALAARKARVNAVGVIGLVENMPSGTAQRPGDIVKSMSGQTIEVLNTDAEGRLVLADALWYTQETFKPQLVIDLATLTGAIVVALGETTAGLFSNDDSIAEKLLAASRVAGEPVWRMPLSADYDKDIDSDFADMKNIGSGRGAGSSTAAQVLQRFIQKDVKWAHLDIAGVTWTKKPTSLCPKGATGFGVRLLQEFVHTNYES